jgi:hypothetical protein
MARLPTVRPSPRPKRGFLARRWHGETELRTLFWRDTILVGSLVNLVFVGVALALLAAGAPAAVVFLVYVLPVPYNLFLFACIWRQAAELGGVAPFAVRSAALGWLALSIIL